MNRAKKNKLAYLFLSLFFSLSLSAFFVEPGLDFSTRSNFKKTISSTTFRYKSFVSNFSFRTGLKRDEISVGLTYARSILNYRYRIYDPGDQGSTGNLLNRSHENVGFFFGYHFLENYRLLASYFVYSKLKVQSDDSGASPTSKGDTYRGRGFEIEVSRKFFTNLFLGLGWRKISLGEFEDGPTGVKAGFPSGATSKAYVNSIFAKLSYFFDLSQIL